MPSITQLEYIVAVDIERHFGLAAKKCFVTQPTLSAQIKKAEEELGTLVFDRSKQPVLPTAVGQQIIEQARIILREHQRLGQLVSEFKNDVSGKLRIGVLPTIAPYLLPLFIGDFIREYPKIDLQIKEQTTENILENLENDALDVGILVTPLHNEHIREIPLFYDEIQLYVHPKHQFAENSSVAPELISKEKFWMLSHGHCFRNQVINLCSLEQNNNNKNLPFDYEGGSLEGLQRLVDKEGGFTLLPELANLQTKENVRTINTIHPLREVSLVYVRNYAKIKLVKLLEETIKKAIPNHMLDKSRGQVVEII